MYDINLFQALPGVALTVALYLSIKRMRFALPKRYFAYACVLLVSSCVTQVAALHLGGEALLVASRIIREAVCFLLFAVSAAIMAATPVQPEGTFSPTAKWSMVGALSVFVFPVPSRMLSVFDAAAEPASGIM